MGNNKSGLSVVASIAGEKSGNMHELSYITRLCKIAEATAVEQNAKSVDTLSIQVGEMTGLIPEYLQRYYPGVVKGTILDGSKLEIEYLPVKTRCSDCGELYHPCKDNSYLCPNCSSPKGEIINGREFLIKNMIIDD
ncbi:hydrogenase maturation nickel metallochaperone HypA/HybF [Butyrivibrio sp. MC2013]|uniref:hydrogenase maturation nickel metallochaperone HypA/HybF n=1 Tax=Butyrivibrio sp. MC2013 TaxID=1280686 RepID=UPI00040AFF2B|nr:hydrogenase maturation nickel metallochaperone HypA [Butyrivibrio sp. MC2013]